MNGNLTKIIKLGNDFISCNESISHSVRWFYEKKNIFYKKSLAYDFSNANGRLPIFSVDTSDTEAKKAYIVTGYCKWWEDYTKMKPNNRYAYEVVLPKMPCHLYVDIEVEFSSNPELRDIIDLKFIELMKELKRFMYYIYLAPANLLKAMKFVVLDSSKISKFSKHSIIKIPGVLFEDNYQIGAFIRRFQVHILCKFGPKETNPYFVYPENQKKRSPEFKHFLIDMGVYTKGRDFRLLGSFKRTGNSTNPGKKKRFLWLHDYPGSLTDKHFFDTLIQFQPKPSTIKYMVCHLVDTINGGIPMSSSLRTVVPVGSTYNGLNGVESSTGNSRIRSINSNKRFKTNIIQLPNEILNRITQRITSTYNISITSIKSSGSSYFFNTTCKVCKIKSEITRTNNACHSKNSIYFMLCGTTGVVFQSCFNQSYCYDTRSGKHRIIKLFTLREEATCKILMDWCEANGWEWKGDDFIPDKWMGTDDTI